MNTMTDRLLQGAGAAGSSTAYYLRQDAAKAGIPVDITVFERSSYIGGRSTTVMAYGDTEPVELGASIFVDVNEILRNRSAEFGLEPKASETEGQELLGIWDGRQFVYMQQQEEGWRGYWNMAKLLVRLLITYFVCIHMSLLSTSSCFVPSASLV